jgi:valyl-tRNA synthetase
MIKYGADGVRMGMLLTSPAGNDIRFDEALCEQGRNFNNKIWNAFRLVKGRKVDASLPQPQASAMAVNWFNRLLNKTIAEMNDFYDKYRLNEALMSIYKLFWDEFSAWYLEIVKPGYEQPLDRATYQATLGFFDALLRLLHPFMPFITEELWQALEPRQAGESIMIAPMPQPGPTDEACLKAFDTTKEIISGIRNIRKEKNIPVKETLTVVISGEHEETFNPVIEKMANVAFRVEASPAAGQRETEGRFLVGTTEYIIPLGNKINVEKEWKKLNEDLDYQKGFLVSIMNKLNNPAFVSKAPANVIESERKKQADAESKIKSLEETLEALKKQ